MENINFNNQKKEINALKNEHLLDGISPIMAGTYDQAALDEESKKYFSDFKKHAQFINFTEDPSELHKSNIINSGKLTYVISEINGEDKYSEGYLDCTGIFASGIDAQTGENISFITHQNIPDFFKKEEIKENFKKDLNSTLEKLKNRCQAGTIDITIMGGNDNVDYEAKNNLIDDYHLDMKEIIAHQDELSADKFESYRKSIKFLNKIISEKFNFSPVVISGFNNNLSKTENNAFSAYFDNKNKRLSLVGPFKNSLHNESFQAKDIEKQIDKIKKEELKK